MSLKYEAASEPLHISLKWLFFSQKQSTKITSQMGDAGNSNDWVMLVIVIVGLEGVPNARCSQQGVIILRKCGCE